jgi:hypothetical protein
MLWGSSIVNTLLLPVVAVVVLTATTSTTTVQAYKDDSYYMPGSGNPNVKEKMYWKDADNVLQDLSKFSELYVQYSHCAWTWMQMEDEGNDVDENGTFLVCFSCWFGFGFVFALFSAR